MTSRLWRAIFLFIFSSSICFRADSATGQCCGEEGKKATERPLEGAGDAGARLDGVNDKAAYSSIEPPLMLKSTHTHMPVVTTSQSKREPRRILLTAMAPSIAPTVNGSDIDLGSGPSSESEQTNKLSGLALFALCFGGIAVPVAIIAMYRCLRARRAKFSSWGVSHGDWSRDTNSEADVTWRLALDNGAGGLEMREARSGHDIFQSALDDEQFV